MNPSIKPQSNPGEKSAILIGYGNQGKEHYRSLLAHPQLNVLAIIEPNRSLWQNELNTPFLSSLNDILLSSDCYIIAVPPHLYSEILPQVGKHSRKEEETPIMIEKPMGMDIEAAASLVNIAHQYNLRLLPAVQRSFHPPYQRIKEFIRTSKDPINTASFTLKTTHSADNWRASKKVGTLLDLGYHALDFLQDAFGDLHIIHSNLFNEFGTTLRAGERDTEAHILLQAEQGTMVKLYTQEDSEKKAEALCLQTSQDYIEVTRSSFKTYRKGEETSSTDYSPKWDLAMQQQLDELQKLCDVKAEIAFAERHMISALNTMKMIGHCYHTSCHE